ncbi:MAG: phage portal protein [Bacilli bacterium]|nr:phage portal protein [Bacilli bacterium]
MKRRYCHGRKVLYASYTQNDLNKEVITEILNKVFPLHLSNKADIQYLEDEYTGIQEILLKENIVRPEINNVVVENYAFFMTEFKKSYVFSKPVKYVQVGETVSDEISVLNKYMTFNRKHRKDVDLAESLYNNGIAHRLVLPSKNKKVPFEITNLNSKNTFIVYERATGNKPLFGVTYYAYKENNAWAYRGSLYTETEYYEFTFSLGRVEDIGNPIPHILGKIPIIEYHLNKSRLGIVEVSMSMRNALNKIASGDMDGLEQAIQALVVFVNNDIDAKTFKELMDLGAVKVKTENPTTPADVKLLINNLDHSNTNIFYSRTLSNMLNIIGIPIPSTKTSGGDTGEARQLGDGWTMADLRADQDELMFKDGEFQMLELVLSICKKNPNCEITSLEPEEVEAKFERNKSDNLLVKTQSLVNLMNAKVSPKSAFSAVGLFSDANAVVEESKDFFGDSWWNATSSKENFTENQFGKTDENDVNNKQDENNTQQAQA